MTRIIPGIRIRLVTRRMHIINLQHDSATVTLSHGPAAAGGPRPAPGSQSAGASRGSPSLKSRRRSARRIPPTQAKFKLPEPGSREPDLGPELGHEPWLGPSARPEFFMGFFFLAFQKWVQY
jgi:hypothetical protein